MNHDTNHRPSGDDEFQPDPALEAEARLTAQALGESHDEAPTTAGAGGRDALADDNYFSEIRRSGSLVRQALADEPIPATSDELRQAVLARLDDLEAARMAELAPAAMPRRSLWLPLSLAASLLVISGTAVLLREWQKTADRTENSTLKLVASGPENFEDDDDILVFQETLVSPTAREFRSTPPGSASQAQDNDNLTTFTDSTVIVSGSVSAMATPQLRTSNPTEVNVRVGELNAYGLRLTKELPQGSMGNPKSFSSSGAPGESLPQARALAGLKSKAMPHDEVHLERSGQFLPPSSSTATGQGGLKFGNAFDRVPNASAPPPKLSGPSSNGKDPWTGYTDALEGGERSTVTHKSLQKELHELQTQESKLAQQLGNDHPQVVAVRKQREKLGIVRQHLQGENVPDRPHNTEAYDSIPENAFLAVADNPLSTFSIDVDTASYSNMRRFLNSGSLPPPGAVRIEELINYFTYDYPQPKTDDPFSVNTEVVACPWNAEHRLLRVGLKGREMPKDQRPASNLVFLLDVSGSMDQPNKLPLVKEAMTMLVDQLGENDRVAIVVYAGASGLVLPSTTGDNKQAIRSALEQLKAGGSTNGASGLELAYKVAQSQFIQGGTNRVILATDGDFNVGVTNQDELVRLIEKRAADGVFFTALGFGFGNLKDSTLEKLADKGNGNYAYIDTRSEAQKVLVEELSGTLVTIAKDVKLQLEFNPARVASFRLIGYENRILAHEDFNNDKKDAGDVGAGHAVTALYEIVPAGGKGGESKIDPLKYQRATNLTGAADSNELLTLKLRYKQPDGQTSKLLEHVVADSDKSYAQASVDTKFAASVAAFGMLLRHSPNAGNANLDAVLELAQEGLGKDPHGYRAEFIELVKKAKMYWPTKQ